MEVSLVVENVEPGGNVIVCDANWYFICADPPSPELIKRGQRTTVFYADVNLLVPVIAAVSFVIFTVAITIVCYKHREYIVVSAVLC